MNNREVGSYPMKASRKESSSWIYPNYETKLGRMYCGRAEEVMEKYPLTRRRGKVQLLFTSPPFPLNTKKKYGNLKGEDYIEWFAGFAPIFSDYITVDGSIVIELGNAWEPGRPTMSTLPLETLLAFKERANLYLCQEFIAFNPAKLPSPVQWVNIKRCRVKDAFTKIWWLSKVYNPKADNKRVLTAYSDSMNKLLKRGTYNPGARPSGHNIGVQSFLSNNSGAIPPNVLIPTITDMLPELVEVLRIPNTNNNDPYQLYCRENDIQPHPARMPAKLVEFFVKFLTDPLDLVLDPFAGSNTSGWVAESLDRRWISIEQDPKYAEASRARFC